MLITYSSWLDINLAVGSFEESENKNVQGTWTLAAGFWDVFDSAVFIIHVGGNAGSSPDDFAAFFITQGEYSGFWSYMQTGANGGGGGLSNVALWTAGTPQISPAIASEPGILLVFGMSLLGLGLIRNRKFRT